MDIVGKLPPAPGQKAFLLVLMDYFSKWVEAPAFSQVEIGLALSAGLAFCLKSCATLADNLLATGHDGSVKNEILN